MIIQLYACDIRNIHTVNPPAMSVQVTTTFVKGEKITIVNGQVAVIAAGIAIVPLGLADALPQATIRYIEEDK